jgi:hypothetical protein
LNLFCAFQVYILKGVDLASEYDLHKVASELQSGTGLGTLDRLRVRVKLVKDSLTPYVNLRRRLK